jgi:hypothetical protein
VKEAGMQPMFSINKTTSVNTRMVEVEEHKKNSQKNIHNMYQFEKESIEEHFLRPTRITHKIQFFVKNAT